MKDSILSWEETVCYIRNLPEYNQLIIDAYLDENPMEASERYFKSGEWNEILKLLPVKTGTVLDLGAGNGIASFSFARSGYNVYALEPDPGETVGREAINKIKNNTGLQISVLDATGENIPITDNSIDIVFARQVLHHAGSLTKMCSEAHRVLKYGGVLIAVREHVISSRHDLEAFLERHPLHKFYGGENAYTLDEYYYAFSQAGFKVVKNYGPYNSVINYAPMTKVGLKDHFVDRLGRYVSAPIARNIVEAEWLYRTICGFLTRRDNTPGRLYSFIARKIPKRGQI